MSYDEEWLDIELQIMHKTGAAVLLSDGDTEEWVPKSAIHNWDEDWEPGDTVSMDVSLWLLEEKGFV